ncbi:unnamed protein product, partial [Allacma fusca]
RVELAEAKALLMSYKWSGRERDSTILLHLRFSCRLRRTHSFRSRFNILIPRTKEDCQFHIVSYKFQTGWEYWNGRS